MHNGQTYNFSCICICEHANVNEQKCDKYKDQNDKISIQNPRSNNVHCSHDIKIV